MTDFGGMHVATVTPFDAAGRPDLSLLRDHVKFLADGGVAGICPCGTTGEFLYLTLGEKVRVIEASCEAARDRLRVIAGVWALTARETAVLIRAAESAGAAAVFLQPPIYYPASDATILRHYAAARESASVPVLAYNIPAYAANEISLDCAERLVEEGTVAGIKDSAGDADRIAALVERIGERAAVLAASDSFATRGRQLGAHGFISALANVWPRAFARLWAGDESLQPAVDAVRQAVKQAGGIPALRRLCELRGFPVGASRLPGGPLSHDQLARLDAAFQKAQESGLD